MTSCMNKGGNKCFVINDPLDPPLLLMSQLNPGIRGHSAARQEFIRKIQVEYRWVKKVKSQLQIARHNKQCQRQTFGGFFRGFV